MASRIAIGPFLILTNLGKDGLSIPSTAGLVLTGKNPKEDPPLEIVGVRLQPLNSAKYFKIYFGAY